MSLQEQLDGVLKFFEPRSLDWRDEERERLAALAQVAESTVDLSNSEAFERLVGAMHPWPIGQEFAAYVAEAERDLAALSHMSGLSSDMILQWVRESPRSLRQVREYYQRYGQFPPTRPSN